MASPLTNGDVLMSSAITVRREVAGAPEEIWAVLAEIDRYPIVFGSIARVRRIAGEGYQNGVTWDESRRVLGRIESARMTLAEVDPGRHSLHCIDWDAQRVNMSFDVEPVETGTAITTSFEIIADDKNRVERALLKVFGGVTSGMIKDVLKSDISDIAAAVRPFEINN